MSQSRLEPTEGGCWATDNGWDGSHGGRSMTGFLQHRADRRVTKCRRRLILGPKQGFWKRSNFQKRCDSQHQFRVLGAGGGGGAWRWPNGPFNPQFDAPRVRHPLRELAVVLQDLFRKQWREWHWQHRRPMARQVALRTGAQALQGLKRLRTKGEPLGGDPPPFRRRRSTAKAEDVALRALEQPGEPPRRRRSVPKVEDLCPRAPEEPEFTFDANLALMVEFGTRPIWQKIIHEDTNARAQYCLEMTAAGIAHYRQALRNVAVQDKVLPHRHTIAPPRSPALPPSSACERRPHPAAVLNRVSLPRFHLHVHLR